MLWFFATLVRSRSLGYASRPFFSFMIGIFILLTLSVVYILLSPMIMLWRLWQSCTGHLTDAWQSMQLFACTTMQHPFWLVFPSGDHCSNHYLFFVLLYQIGLDDFIYVFHLCEILLPYRLFCSFPFLTSYSVSLFFVSFIF